MTRFAFILRRIPTARLDHWLASFALPLLASCAIIHHDSPPAAIITPQQIRLADDIHLANEGWPSARWWEQYHDPQLDTLVDLALTHAPTLAIAREHVSQAHAQVELIRAGSGLQMSAIADADRERVSGHGFLSAYASHDPAIGAFGPWYWTGLVGIDAHYDIDVWGKQRDLVRAAIGEQNARRAEAAQAELEVSAGVAQLYYSIQITYASIELLRQLREVRAFEFDTLGAARTRPRSADPDRRRALAITRDRPANCIERGAGRPCARGVARAGGCRPRRSSGDRTGAVAGAIEFIAIDAVV